MRNSELPVPLSAVSSGSAHAPSLPNAPLLTSAAQPLDGCETLDDAELIRAVQRGCDRSFDLLFARYWKLVFAIASRILRQRSEAEDVVQDVFLAIYMHSGNYDPTRGSVRTWIAQFAHFKALVRRRSIYISDGNEPQAISEFEEGLLRFGKTDGVLERAALVQECLALLNPRQRRIVELVHFDGYTLSEAATILNQSLANTRSLYYRGIHSMRTQLQEKQMVPVKSSHAVAPMADAIGSLSL